MLSVSSVSQYSKIIVAFLGLLNMRKYLIASLIGLCGCTSSIRSSQSAADANVSRAQQRNAETRFQLYGPFSFMGKYRVQHEWLHEDPRGSHYCQGYNSVREDIVDDLGKLRPAQIGMEIWEDAGILWQREPYFKPDGVEDMTRFVIGNYRPKAPGGPRYDHEALCTTAYDGIGTIFNLYLKKITLEGLRNWDQQRMLEWRYAKLLEPLKYETTQVNGVVAEKLTQVVALGLKGLEDKPVRRVTEDIRVPIGDTGYVYQLTFTLSDAIVQNEPEKAVRRRAYWQRIQDSFRIDPIR